MKKVLVTGGGGFVGRHLCKALLDRGDQVVCVDSIVPMTGGLCPQENGWPLFNPLDYRNFLYVRQDCRRFFEECGHTDFDEVFHLAAMVGGREMIESNPLAVAEDLAIDSLFWQWAKRVHPRKTVCFSSSAAYPVKHQQHQGHVLLTEDMIDFSADIGMPDMSYGWAKLTHEYLARLAYDRHGIKSVVYRPFSGYGEDQDGAYPFPSICRRALRHRNSASLSVWGTGEQMRDFIHIDDCVRGVLSTMGRIDDAAALNLSTGVLTSFKEFARLAADILGYAPVVSGASDKPEGVFARGGHTAKQAEYGFVAQIPFRAGVEQALRYLEGQEGAR